MNSLKELIGDTINERLSNANLNSQENTIRKYILLELAKKSKVPTYQKIIEKLKLPNVKIVDKTIKKLEEYDLLQRRGNEIISSYPFSVVETRHKVIFEDGHEVYALCSVDALGIHFMLEKNITILTKCPQCENEIKIILKNGQIHSYYPEGIIEFLSVNKKCGCTAKDICPFINFFCSRNHLEEWKTNNIEYSNGLIFTIYDVLEQSRFIFGNLLK